jgi:hypothetical protein
VDLWDLVGEKRGGRVDSWEVVIGIGRRYTSRKRKRVHTLYMGSIERGGASLLGSVFLGGVLHV